jgi:BirA family biotin operon repressor/biotin-[acetyl-CoA-carboxylase] ligase
MNTKSKVLELLELNRGTFFSGEQIAATLGISRTAVWKVVHSLTKEGYCIEGIERRGYRLNGDCENLSERGITTFLHHKIPIRIYDCVESTNDIAKELAAAGAENGTVVIAERQSSGKGRHGRPFHSPRGGLYMSVILHGSALPPALRATPTLVTALSAVAVCRAIEKLTVKRPKIKWVNDIFLNNRKICGISAEAATDFVSGLASWIVIGIGVNRDTPVSAFPEEFRKIAGALFTVGESPTVSRNQLAAEIINFLLNASEFRLADYKGRICHLGKRVTITNPLNRADLYTATAVDIDEVGRLVIRKSNGEIVALSSGEVSLKV